MALTSLVSASFSFESQYFSGDSDDVEISSSRSMSYGKKRRVSFYEDCSSGKCELPLKRYTPVTPTSLIDKPLIVNHFSSTLSYKFTRMTYEKIRELLSPNLSALCYGLEFCKKPTKGFRKNIGYEVYILLRNAITTVPPCLFDPYLKAFLCGDFSCCYLLLERYFSCDEECEERIISCLQKPEDFRKCVQVNCVVFFDCITGETCDVIVDDCPCEKPVCVYLPRQLLCFEDFLCLSFCIDESILRLLSKITGCDYANVYFKMLKEYYCAFPLLSEEQRITSFIRIKFFAFNAIAYQISLITTDKKKECIMKLLGEIKSCRNDLFFKSFATGLGLLNK